VKLADKQFEHGPFDSDCRISLLVVLLDAVTKSFAAQSAG